LRALRLTRIETQAKSKVDVGSDLFECELLNFDIESLAARAERVIAKLSAVRDVASQQDFGAVRECRNVGESGGRAKLNAQSSEPEENRESDAASYWRPPAQPVG
jgi:hypothetical protein